MKSRGIKVLFFRVTKSQRDKTWKEGGREKEEEYKTTGLVAGYLLLSPGQQ